jgi:predicted nucleic acid-binding protein
MELIDSRKLVLLFSQDTIGELMYMIKQYSIIKINKDIIRVQLMHELADLFFYGISVNTSETTCPNINDSNDEMFLKCATEGKAEFLISDDFKSGMHLIKDAKVKVVSTENFIKAYDKIQELRNKIVNE